MLVLGSTSLAAPAAATSRALAPQGPAPDCPSIAEVNATPFAERWAVWDVPRCSSGCKFPSDQCGLGAPCCVHQRWAASRISSSRVTLSGNASNASASEDLRAEIPPVLLLTARDPSVLPEKVLRSWIDLNPGLRFEVSSDADCLAYLRSAWGERHARFFESIRDGPIKADFWRAAKLYRDGGVYTDVDLQPVLPLSSVLEQRLELVVPLGAPLGIFKGELFNAFIAVRPRHPVLLDYANRMLALADQLYDYSAWSGTRHMRAALKAYLNLSDATPLAGGDYPTAGGRAVRVLRELCPEGIAQNGFQSCYVEATKRNALERRTQQQAAMPDATAPRFAMSHYADYYTVWKRRAGRYLSLLATVVAGRSAASSAPELQRILLLAETNASDANATNGSVLL